MNRAAMNRYFGVSAQSATQLQTDAWSPGSGSQQLSANYSVTEQFNIGADAISVSGSYARGNENNDHQSGGLYYGSGKIGGYTVFNLNTAYQITPDWRVFARVNNLFDREYATAGMLGANPFDASGVMRTDGAAGNGTVNGRRSNAVGETFVAPGAPRTAWIGVRYEFGGPNR